jgi:alpha-tubulin suppressor-like RCC1 family protein
VLPSGVNSVIQIDAGLFHTVVLKQTGAVLCWGSNSFGETNVPAEVVGATAVAAGGRHTLAVVPSSDAGVVAWGSNVSGQLAVPPSLGAIELVSVSAGSGHSVALDVLGSVYAWGDDAEGQVSAANGFKIALQVCAGGSNSALVDLAGIECLADFDGDGVVGGADLTLLLAQWGTAGPATDLDGNGLVGGADLTILLALWGKC